MRVGVLVALLFGLGVVACALDRVGGGAVPSDGGTSNGGAGASGGSGGASGGSGGASGGSGGAFPEPCDGQCTDMNATCNAENVCLCNSGWVDLDDVVQSANCEAAITNVNFVRVGVDHSWVGHLTFKLQSPDGTELILVSRPGYDEPADDGAGDQPGRNAKLSAASPIDFTDTAPTLSENMGGTPAFPVAGTICGPTLPCDFRPSIGTTATNLKPIFEGRRWSGSWRFCAGDSVVSEVGSIKSVQLRVTTGQGIVSGIETVDTVIPDGTYNGQQSSMACVTLALTPE